MKEQSNQDVALNRRARADRERGASLVQYSLLVALISCAVLASVRVVGATVKQDMFDAVNRLEGSAGFEDGD